ncbi:MAG: hemerythrin domain-containing protein [Candidatus Limnocylindrales bacterium]
MTQTLPQVAHEHHERLLLHVDRMPQVADLLLTAKAEDVRASLVEMGRFLEGTLLPHIDAAERTLYPEFERMFQNRHSMAPMRREHTEIRRLVAEFVKLGEEVGVGVGQVTIGRTLAIRRVMFQLYSLLKIHLAEEDAYLRIVDHGVTADVAEMLAAAMDHPGIATA